MPIAQNTKRFAIAGPLLLSLAACSQPTPSSLVEGMWTVDGSTSTLSFVTVKNGDVGEAHGFKKLGGSVEPDGTATLTIDLASVDTGVEIRDQRMRDVLFETGIYPEATVTVQLDPASFAKLGIGESITQKLLAKFDLHGMTSDVEADVEVLRAGSDRVEVSTIRPVILDAGSLGLGDGVEKLRNLAGLPTISSAVPVSFSITYKR